MESVLKMSKIKGLYFKLNLDNKNDLFIYNFFNKKISGNKIDALYTLIDYWFRGDAIFFEDPKEDNND